MGRLYATALSETLYSEYLEHVGRTASDQIHLDRERAAARRRRFRPVSAVRAGGAGEGASGIPKHSRRVRYAPAQPDRRKVRREGSPPGRLQPERVRQLGRLDDRG